MKRNIPPMKKGPSPRGLSLRLEAMAVGAREIAPVSKDRVRATIQVPRGRMNTHYPERRFELASLGPGRTMVKRLPDVDGQDWEAVWARAVELETQAQPMGRPSFTYVPRRHGLAMWARERRLGFVDGEWWAWEHARGWKAQRAVMKWLRSQGVVARTWGKGS